MQMSPPPSSFGGFTRNLLGSGFFLRVRLEITGLRWLVREFLATRGLGL